MKAIPSMVARLDKWLLLALLPLCFVTGTGMKEKEPATPHPFYISVTQIDHNAAAKTLEISCKMFAEDMEEIVKRNYQAALNLSAPSEKANALLNKYLQQHLQVQADGKTIPLQFIGFEKEAESVYCYLEGGNVPAVKRLVLNNSILQDFTTDQINIMHVTVAGNRKSGKLNYPDKVASFEF